MKTRTIVIGAVVLLVGVPLALFVVSLVGAGIAVARQQNFGQSPQLGFSGRSAFERV